MHVNIRTANVEEQRAAHAALKTDLHQARDALDQRNRRIAALELQLCGPASTHLQESEFIAQHDDLRCQP